MIISKEKQIIYTKIEDNTIDQVETFEYLGAIINSTFPVVNLYHLLIWMFDYYE